MYLYIICIYVLFVALFQTNFFTNSIFPENNTYLPHEYIGDVAKEKKKKYTTD